MDRPNDEHMTGAAPSAASLCPVCGEDSACGAAAGAGRCWCFGEDVDRDLIEWLGERGIDDTCLCRTCAVEGVRSPCDGTCTIESQTKECLGCHRTLGEITSWASMSVLDRAQIQLRLRTRADDAPH